MSEDTEDLVYQLKVALATTFTFYMKAHNYHINVTGPLFSQYHEFFGSIYEETWAWTDTLGEQIRTLDSYTPFSHSRFLELSLLTDETRVLPDTASMINVLVQDNQTLLQCLYTAHKAAQEIKNVGITSSLEVLIDATQKRHWMLKAHI